MKIALITPTPPDISAFGVRSLASFLKSHGHTVLLIFLPGGIDLLDVNGHYIYHYPTSILEDITSLVEDCDVVGLSFMTQYFDRARQISEALRSARNQKQVWGGFHPTLCPEESLQWADFVIEGEGEFPLLELIHFLEGKQPWEKVPNTWRKGDRGDIISPSQYYWMDDIAPLPDFDFSLEEHFVTDVRNDRIVPLTPGLMESILPQMPAFNGAFLRVYRTMTSRGCPHQCSYCINRTLKQKYCQGTYLRRRTNQQVISELKNVTTRFPFIQGIHFFDDSFFSNSKKSLIEFARSYTKEIALPFYCQGSPESISAEKLELLIDAGLIFTEMGIQTGSEKIAKLFRRSASNDQIKRGIATIDEFRHKLLKPHYHVIVDTPWEDDDDVRQTLNMLLGIPHPFMLCLASLTLFPGTELHEKALKENIISDPMVDIYRKAFYKAKPTYLNLLIMLTDHPLVPKFIIRFLSNRTLSKMMSWRKLKPVWKFLFFTDKISRYAIKVAESIRYGNLWRISQFFRARLR